MNKTLHLTLTLLKTSFDLGIGKKGKKTSKSKSGIMILFLMFLFIISFSMPITFLIRDLVTNLTVINLPEIVWYVILPIASITIAILSLFTVISILFLSSDNKVLLFMPLTPKQIITARFLVVLIYTYLLESFFLVPIIGGYGIALNLPLSFYIISITNALLLPIIPLGLLVLLLSYILRFTNLSKYRDLFTYIAMGIVLSMALAFNYFFTQAISTIELDPVAIAENIKNLLDVYGSVINSYFPYLIFNLQSIISNNLGNQIINLIIAIAINLTVIIFIVLFVGPIYLKTIIGSDERSKSKSKSLTLSDTTKTRNSFLSLVVLEWRTLVRSPIYFLNLVVIVFLLPIIIGASFIFGSSASGAQLDIQDIVALMTSLEFNYNNPFFVSLIYGAALFLASTTFIAPTAISRLGGSAPFFKALPISYLKFINFKVFWANVLIIGPTLLYLLIANLNGFLGLWEMLLFGASIIPLFIFTNYLGLFIDLLNPKLDWLSEQQAVKSNLNAVFYMIAMWALTALIVYSGYLLNDLNLTLNGYHFSAIILATSIFANILVVAYIQKKGYKLFKGVF
jgi:ABC-2 type transport system permease protein